MTFQQIYDKLAPHSSRGWSSRFKAIENRGQDAWLTVVRDFPVDTPEIEQLVNEIVIALEPKMSRPSLVRAEMEKLEAEGKLALDKPEEVAYWEKRLEEERIYWAELDKKQDEARKRQAEMDRQHREKLANKEAEPATPSVQTETPAAPVVETEMPTTEEKLEPTVNEAPSAPSFPKMKSVTVGSETVFKDDSKTPTPTPLSTLEGMPEDMIKTLAKRGISTVESFQKMDPMEAKAALGSALFQRFSKMFK